MPCILDLYLETAFCSVLKPDHIVMCISSADLDQFTVLKTVADTLGQAAVSGNLSQSIGFNVSSVGVILPSPPPSDPTWSQVRWEQSNVNLLFYGIFL